MGAGFETKEFTVEEVAKHNKEGDLWVIIDAKVYDLSRFAALHPGGLAVLLDADVAGQDATSAFYGLHRHEVLLKPQYAKLCVGSVKGQKPVIQTQASGELSNIPYAEPSWLSEGYSSPYYNESHRRFQKATRKFFDEVVYPDAQAREEDGKKPSEHVTKALADAGYMCMRLGPGKHLQGRVLIGGAVKPEEFDYFHELILDQELVRIKSRGYQDALFAGGCIGLPPVLHFGPEPLRSKVLDDVLSGRKWIALAVTEAFAGSDVGGIRATASLTPDGQHFILNGTKKWITNGSYADYFTVACKTSKGMTVLLVERGEGVETKHIKTSYGATSGTAYVTFDNVKVPVGNVLGKEGGGMKVVLSNFNHERWVMCCTSARAQRSIVEVCLKWASQRKVFGKPLISQAVVRAKLANMISRVEAAQNWLENVTHQMNNMNYAQQSDRLAGQIAFLKVFCTKNAQATAEDAVQMFGGRGITRTGMGKFIEEYHRTVPFDAVLGGAEDVLLDLGVRQAVRKMPKDAKL